MVLDLEQDKNIQQFRSRVILGQAQRPKMLDLVLKTGIVKSESAAATFLIIVTVLIFAVSILIFLTTRNDLPSTPPPIMYPDGSMSPLIN